MIAFCCATTDLDAFDTLTAPAMQAAIEADSLLMRRHAPASLADACNEMLDQAGKGHDLEAVVLIDQETTIESRDFLAKVRSLLGDDQDIAVIGVAPAREIPGLVPSRQLPPAGGGEDVDAVDGTLVVLSPWAARELRFDPDFDPSLDGCALDFCLQARSQGRRVLTDSLGAARRRSTDESEQQWGSIVASLRRKWHA